MKIGILGGTFNPPHIGHLILAEQALTELKLDKIFFIPVNMPPHKQTQLAPSFQRLEMVRRAVRGNSKFKVLDCEIKRGGVSYTIDTLNELIKKHPADKFVLLIGSDLAKSFNTWRNYKEIIKLVDIAVVNRTENRIRNKRFIYFSMPKIDINSSLIRKILSRGKSARYLVPERVYRYILENKLYIGGRKND